MTHDRKVFVVCPGCDAVNRVPADRLGNRPVCGRCRARLFPGRPVELSARNFDVHVGRSGIPVLVDFWAPWCGPCRMMAPAFEQAAGELEPHLRLAKVNTEAEPELAARFGVRAVPTLIVFREGREAARHSGALPLPALVDWARRSGLASETERR